MSGLCVFFLTPKGDVEDNGLAFVVMREFQLINKGIIAERKSFQTITITGDEKEVPVPLNLFVGQFYDPFATVTSPASPPSSFDHHFSLLLSLSE